MGEIFNALFVLGVCAPCVSLLRSKRARAFIRRRHPSSHTEDGLMGWFVIPGIVGMASFVFGSHLLISSALKLAR